jgi:hypothetical protein
MGSQSRGEGCAWWHGWFSYPLPCLSRPNANSTDSSCVRSRRRRRAGCNSLRRRPRHREKAVGLPGQARRRAVGGRVGSGRYVLSCRWEHPYDAERSTGWTRRSAKACCGRPVLSSQPSTKPRLVRVLSLGRAAASSAPRQPDSQLARHVARHPNDPTRRRSLARDLVCWVNGTAAASQLPGASPPPL